MSVDTQARVPVGRHMELHISESRHTLQSVSVTCQIQDEAAAPPDGVPHASRKTRRWLAMTDREILSH